MTNFSFLGLSIGLGFLTYFAVFGAANRFQSATGIVRLIWHFAAAAALGGGIWLMTVIGLFAWDIQSLHASSLVESGFAILLAIAFSGTGLFVTDRDAPNRGIVMAAALFIGLGLSIMFFVQLGSVRSPEILRFDPLGVLATVLLFVTSSAVSLWIIGRTAGLRTRGLASLAGTGLFLLAIFSGVAATSFGDPSSPMDPVKVWMAVGGLSIGGALFLCLVIGTATIDRFVGDRLRLEARLLRDSERRFRLLIDGVRDCALFMLDRNGNVASWNSGAERLTGYQEEEITGKSFALFHTEDDIDQELPAITIAVASESGFHESEGTRKRRDGEEFIAAVTMHRLDNPDGTLAGFSVLLRDVTENRTAQLALQRAHDDLERQVALRTIELEDSTAAAEEANKAKSEFLANMSHELRTPLTAVIGYAELLLQDMEDLENDAAVSDITRILRSSRHLLHLINEILDLAKIEAGHTELRYEAISIETFLSDLKGTIAPLVAENDNTLEIINESDGAPFNVDGHRLRQCMLNLIGNAAKFTKQGRIVIHVSPRSVADRPGLRFSVRDSGIGMTEEQLARVFEAFTQAESSTTRAYGGTGLGLTITKKLVDVMGGEIDVTSEQGIGTTMWIDLPNAGNDAKETDADDLDNALLVDADENTSFERIEDIIGDIDAEFGFGGPRGSEISKTLPQGNNLILLVEDNPDNREMIQRQLELEDIRVITAADGFEAVERVSKDKPGLVLMDLSLPGQSGLEATRAIRRDPSIAATPIIALTAHAFSNEREECLEAGCDGFVTKPIDWPSLKSTIESLLETS